jgi:hypothetical protein
MFANNIKIGQRVEVGGRTALVVGRPEYYTANAKLVLIKFENSTRYERKLSNQMSLLPTAEQYAAHGGNYVKPEGEF